MKDLHVDDPIALFSEWLEDAKATQMEEPTAVALATVNPEGMPSVRMVLLKGVDARGFVFYTNLRSQKARELSQTPQASLCMYHMPLRRQARVSGRVEQVSDAEADAYFAARPRQSRIGAWASKQSQVMDDPGALQKRVAYFAARYAIGEVPRPAFWSGYRVVPHEIEFWRSGAFRLHERARYVRSGDGEDGPWRMERLYP